MAEGDAGARRTCRRPTTRRSLRSSLLARTEGIIPALETAHAFARVGDVARQLAEKHGRPVTMVLGLSGRGDKDLATLLSRLGVAP